LDHLELIRPQLPLINVTKIYVLGFSYLGSKFSLKVDKKHKKLTFFELNDDLRIVTEQKVFDVIKNVECEFFLHDFNSFLSFIYLINQIDDEIIFCFLLILFR
jgi:hypothetical protein